MNESARHVLRDRVWRDLESGRRGQPIQSDDVAELGDKAGTRHAEERPTNALQVMAVDITPDREPEDVARLMRVAEL